ncbi:MAG: hypothetical protein Q4C50_01700 [Eubacteriales bacterium]|nr:hypothetical protein [Eubacteriales bacterium]
MRKKLFAAVLSFCICLSGVSPAWAQDSPAETETETASERTTAAENGTEGSADTGTETETETEAVTAGELLEKSMEYLSEVKSSTSQIEFCLNAGIGASSEDREASSTEYGLKGLLTLKTIAEPLQAGVTGSIQLTYGSFTQDFDVELYLTAEKDNTAFDLFAQASADGRKSEWQHLELDADDLFNTLGITDLDELKEKGLSGSIFEAKDWEVEETGESYLLTRSQTPEDTLEKLDLILNSPLLSDIPSMYLDMLKSAAKGISADITYTLDKDTCAPLHQYIDYGKSDFSEFSRKLSELVNSILDDASAAASSTDDAQEAETDREPVQVDLTLMLNDYYISQSNTYNDVEEIQIPAEALLAKVFSVSDLLLFKTDMD